MTDPLDTIRRAVNRATELLKILDQTHTHEGLYARVRAVREELNTVQGELTDLFSDILAPTPGKVRADGSATSRAAAAAIRTRSGSQRHMLLAELGYHDLADWQLQQRTNIGASSERPRRVELVQAGYVQAARDDLHDTRDGPLVTRTHPHSGLECQVWTITSKGRAALAQLDAGQIALAFPDPA